MAIGVSLNNIALGIGVGVAIGAGLATTQMTKENSSSEEENPTFVGFFVCCMMGRFIYASNRKSLNYIWNCYAYCGSIFSFFQR